MYLEARISSEPIFVLNSYTKCSNYILFSTYLFLLHTFLLALQFCPNQRWFVLQKQSSFTMFKLGLVKLHSNPSKTTSELMTTTDLC